MMGFNRYFLVGLMRVPGFIPYMMGFNVSEYIKGKIEDGFIPYMMGFNTKAKNEVLITNLFHTLYDGFQQYKTFTSLYFMHKR